MVRLRLLLGIAALSAMLITVVALCSPYAPMVAPAMDIEKIWAIEDARTESEAPLVTRLYNGDMPLGYDARENTFYCTLGMDNEENWPDIHLTTPGADGVKLAFVDDYSYDWCFDAIRDGYPYQVIAYTEKEFAYTQIVFTSLPIVTLTAGTEIPAQEDVPVDVTISWQGEETAIQTGRAHRRGATSLEKTPKNGFRVEFTRGINGKKCEVMTPVLGATKYITLLPCSIDPLMIRDRLSWDMYNTFMGADQPFGNMQTRYVELFVDDDYHGVYLYMKSYDYAKEMARKSAQAAATDSFYRLIDRTNVIVRRPLIRDRENTGYEQFYAPAGEDDFRAIKPFIELIELEDDAEFCRRAMELLDIDSLIRYALFIEACGLRDNEFNNMCIWAHRDENGFRYSFYPWDLDYSWGVDDDRDSEIWYTFNLFNRLLRLDCGGIMRERTLAIWKHLRETTFNQENMERFMTTYDQELNGSGAFYRNALRWERNQEALDTYEIYSYALSRFEMMDRRIEEMASAELKDRQIEIDLYETRDGGALKAQMSGM